MLATFRRSSRRGARLRVLPLALLVGLALPASAQVSNAVVTGIVADAQGGILPGVTITVTNAESGVVRTIVTEENGRYRLGGIPPGRYNLRAELPGFATQEVKDITLTIGLEYAKDFTMDIQGVQESITITGESPIVETTRTEVAGVVTQQQIETLPIQDRGTLSLTLLRRGLGSIRRGPSEAPSTSAPEFRPVQRAIWSMDSRTPRRSAASNARTFPRRRSGNLQYTRLRSRHSSGSARGASCPSPPRAERTISMVSSSSSSATNR